MPNQDDSKAPVQITDTGSPFDDAKNPEEGIALCLSGGGYRAMLFHVGALWRLNDAGYLPKLTRISSVSGGSITAGVMAMNWAKLDFDSVWNRSRFRYAGGEAHSEPRGKDH